MYFSVPTAQETYTATDMPQFNPEDDDTYTPIEDGSQVYGSQ